MLITRNPRRDAVEILYQVLFKGATSTQLISEALQQYDNFMDARLLNNIVLGTLRRYLTLKSVLEMISDRPVGRIQPIVQCIIYTGLFQLLFLDRIPPHSAVNEAVKIAKALKRKSAGFVNALLRRAAREKGKLIDNIGRLPLEVRVSIPQYLIKQMHKALKEAPSIQLLEALNAPSVTYMRVNLSLISREDFVQRLLSKGIEVKPAEFTRGGVVMSQGTMLSTLGIVPHLALPQDLASQLVVEVLNPEPGERIADLCAGRGIKTTQILEYTGDQAEVWAVEINQQKLQSLKELARARRVSNFRQIRADAGMWHPRLLFDKVLLDAPCTGSGTIQRRPEVRYRISEKDLKIVELQKALLKNAVRLTKPGGLIVYAVCSFFQQEGPEVTASVIRELGDLVEEVDIKLPYRDFPFKKGGKISIIPGFAPMDGFFIALLKRNVDGPATTVQK